MMYQLNETDKAQFQTLREQIFFYYREEDALKIDVIIERALLNGWMDKNDIYELIEILPRIIPSLNNIESHIMPESLDADWNEYIDERRGRYKREVERLYQLFSNWIFMQSVVQRKNMKPLESQSEKTRSNNIGHGIRK